MATVDDLPVIQRAPGFVAVGAFYGMVLSFIYGLFGWDWPPITSIPYWLYLIVFVPAMSLNIYLIKQEEARLAAAPKWSPPPTQASIDWTVRQLNASFSEAPKPKAKKPKAKKPKPAAEPQPYHSAFAPPPPEATADFARGGDEAHEPMAVKATPKSGAGHGSRRAPCCPCPIAGQEAVGPRLDGGWCGPGPHRAATGRLDQAGWAVSLLPRRGAERPLSRGRGTSRAVGRVLSRASVAGRAVTVIHLGWPLPTTSSALPVCSGGPPSNAHCLGLLRMGFTEPTWSPRPLVVSYTTVSPLPRSLARPGRSVLCGTVPRVTPGGC